MPHHSSKSHDVKHPVINLPHQKTSFFNVIGLNQLRHQAASHPKQTLVLSFCAAAVGLLAWHNEQPQTAYAAWSISAYQMLAFLIEYSRVLPFDFHATKHIRQFEEGDVIDPKTGKKLAALNYEGNCPVLYILTQDPFEQGRAAALATHKQNVLAFTKFYRLAPTLLATHNNLQRMLKGQLPHSSSYYENYEAEQQRIISFPNRLQNEMTGFVEGYNEMLERYGWPYFFAPPPLTKDELEALLRTPDSYKMLACSVAAQQTATGSEAIRLFDFEMLGNIEVKGAYLIVKPTEHTANNKPQWTMSFTHAPGFIRVSLINNHHLAVFANEATNMTNKRHYPDGLPELALANAIAENCRTVDEAIAFIQDHPAATSHLLTIMDPENRVCVQLLPLRSNEPFTLIGHGKQQLPVTNHMLDVDGNRMPETDSWITSLARYTLIEEAFRNGTSMQDLARALSVPQTAHMLHLQYERPSSIAPSATAEGDDHRSSPKNTSSLLRIGYHWGARHPDNRSQADIEPDKLFEKASSMHSA